MKIIGEMNKKLHVFGQSVPFGGYEKSLFMVFDVLFCLISVIQTMIVTDLKEKLLNECDLPNLKRKLNRLCYRQSVYITLLVMLFITIYCTPHNTHFLKSIF